MIFSSESTLNDLWTMQWEQKVIDAGQSMSAGYMSSSELISAGRRKIERPSTGIAPRDALAARYPVTT
jgi:hypothetical protein